MTGSFAVRLLRIVIVTMLFAAVAIAPSQAAPVPQPQPTATGQQDEVDSQEVPGFGDLPEEATLISSASGALDEPADAPATLIVERLSVEPGASLDPVDGPQIIQVEQGLLTFEDDLGLEAEIAAGSAQFFDAGEVDAISNNGEEPAVLVRTSVNAGAPSSDDEDVQPTEEPTEDDSDEDEEDNQGGDESETRDRDRDREEEEDGESAGINALFLQSTPAPDEVVLTLTEDGFEPDEFELVQGGELVIENATEAACLFEIPDLSIEAEIGAGDIESVTVDGSAGTHEFTCTNEDEDVVGEGSFFLARPETTPEPDETEEPAATPSVDEATPIATPEPDETETATPTEPAIDTEATMGVLIEATLESVPGDAQSLFAAQIVLDPEGSLSLAGAGGSIGIAGSGGDLTVTRPGHSPARLRDGRSVLLPDGIIATLTNNGDAPITLQVAGLVGESDPVDEEPTEEPDNGDDNGGDNGGDDGPADLTGANQFIPSDAEMEQLGLFVLGRGPEELTDPADNSIWFEDADQAEELLPTFDWQSTVINLYDSDSEETDYGSVELFVINVDVFADDGNADDFFNYVGDEIFGGQGRGSDVVVELEGVDQEMYVSFFNSETEFDVGFMVIQTDEYVITLYTQGADLDATTLMEDVASLIFGPRG